MGCQPDGKRNVTPAELISDVVINLEDEIGLKLAAPHEGWRDRLDMNPEWTRRIRAAIVARARFVEDLVVEQAGLGVSQYVILGAGLDTFARSRGNTQASLRSHCTRRALPRTVLDRSGGSPRSPERSYRTVILFAASSAGAERLRSASHWNSG